MKHLFAILLMLSGLATADNGGFARAAEFGAPRLNLSEPKYISPSPEREWKPAGEPPLRAVLLRIEGEWGNNARVVLRSPLGRIVRVPARALSDADLDAVEQWMRDNEFITLDTYKHGSHKVRLISAFERTGFSFGLYKVRFARPDGSIHTWSTNNREVFPVELREGTTGPVYMPPESSSRITEFLKKQQLRPNEPLLIAEDEYEAMAYSAMHGLNINIIYLNRRGSATDVAFRHYLETHPYAGAHWNNRHVFLLVYSGDDGRLSGEVQQAITTLMLLQEKMNPGRFDANPAEGMPEYFEQMMLLSRPTHLRGRSIPDYNYRNPAPGAQRAWEYPLEEFLKTPAASIEFGLDNP